MFYDLMGKKEEVRVQLGDKMLERPFRTMSLEWSFWDAGVFIKQKCSIEIILYKK